MEQLTKRLLTSLEIIASKSSDQITKCDESIVKCKELIYTLKKHILDYTFKTLQEEIHFFKEIKQIPLSNVIYYSKLRSFLVNFPIGNIDIQKAYTIKKMEKINRFMRYNHHFIQYIRQGRTELDQYYFTRAHFDGKGMNHYRDYYGDADFCSSHDILFAKYVAYKRLAKFLKKRLSNLSDCNESCNICENSNLKWTLSNTAYVELIYALVSARALNNGQIDISELDKTLSKIFNHESGDIYKTFSEIRRRTKSRTKFLDDLSFHLRNRMDRHDS